MIQKRTRNKLPIGVVLSTLFIAIFCDVKAINSFFVAGAGDMAETESGPMAYLYLLSVFGAFLSGMLFYQWRGRRFSTASWFIVIWVSLFYLITVYFIAPPFTSVMLFVVLTVISLLLPSFSQVDGRLFLKLSMLFSLPAVFRLNDVFVLYYDESDFISMGQSYAFLFPVIAAIVYFTIYFKKESPIDKLFSIVLFAVNSIYAYYLISYGSRGPALSILAVVFFCMVFRHREGGVGIKMRKGRFVMIAVIIVIVAFAFLSLMRVFQGVLEGYGLSINFVNKFLRLGEGGDLTNGREALYSLSFSDIVRHPLFGMGLDQFYNNHGNSGAAYPHNFIIQILYDGGILLLLVLAIPVLRGLKRVWKMCTRDEYAVVVALAFSAVPRAMFSGDLWQNGPLWMLFGILLCERFVLGSTLGVTRY